MNEWTAYCLGLLPTIICGVAVFLFQRKTNKYDAKREKLQQYRQKESMLHLKLLMASNKMSYAVAMAVKRGTPNGEIEEGIDAYEDAKKEYYLFLDSMAHERLNDRK